MKKKNYGSDEENEFEVDEPEEIQNDGSEDDWTPEVDNSRGRRSSRLRNIPKSRAPIIDPSSSDEEGSDNSGGPKRKAGKGRGRGRQPAKKHKVSSSSPATTPAKAKSEDNENEEDEDEEDDDEEDMDNSNENSDSEPTSTTANNSNNFMKINKDFTSGAFVILKTDADNEDVDPPLWKIDGKALLQKYIPFEQDGKTLYKNTSVYSGWTITNKDNYYPVSVAFKQQTRKEHIVEFRRDQIKKDQPEETEQETEKEAENHSSEEKD